MSDVAIHVEHLSKQYHIGQKVPYMTIREAITNAATTPFKRLIAGSKINYDQGCFWALKNVSFDIEKGEAVGIIGRNGAGKSTLLKVLSRITDPTEGIAKIYGRIGSLLEVGTGFHPELTGRENIYLSGAILGMKKAEIERKFDAIVKFSETEKFLDTPLKHYSSGMQVRLGFAVAAHLEPEILIIDEVLAVGDAEFQKKCLGKMKQVAKDGRTVLFVSHNMDAIERLCSRAIFIEKGTIKKNSYDVHSIINEYLYGNEDSKSAVWINYNNGLNNQWFKPTKFYISDKENKPCQIYGNNTDIWVNIEGYIEKLNPALTIGYEIYNEEGNMLYRSYQTDMPEEKWPTLKTGECILRSKIPKRLLNEGTYRIELIASIHCIEWLFQPGKNAPSVNVIIQGALSDSPLWTAKRPGIIAPVIEWYSYFK